MKTRTKKIIRKAERVLSCSGKKITRYTYSVLAGFLLMCGATACGNVGNAADSEDVGDMWLIYCQKYDVDSLYPSDDEFNFFLDCYVGSVEAEEDIIENVIKR